MVSRRSNETRKKKAKKGKTNQVKGRERRQKRGNKSGEKKGKKEGRSGLGLGCVGNESHEA